MKALKSTDLSLVQYIISWNVEQINLTSTRNHEKLKTITYSTAPNKFSPTGEIMAFFEAKFDATNTGKLSTSSRKYPI